MKKIIDKEITLRKSVRQGITDHQGFDRCNCKTCISEMLYSSTCHGNQNCINK